MNTWVYLVLGCWLTTVWYLDIRPLHAAPATDSQRQPQGIQQRITTMEESIVANRARRAAESAAIRQADQHLAKLAAEAQAINTELQRARDRVNDLAGRQRDLERALVQHRDALGTLINASYQTGRTPQLKLLLQQQDPALLGRMLTYYRYFYQAQQGEIQQVQLLLGDLAKIQGEQLQLTQGITTTKKTLAARQQQIVQLREERQQGLAFIDKNLSSQVSQLALLQREREPASRQPEGNAPRQFQPFTDFKGKLHWPTQGRLLASYNSPKGNTGLRWEGMFIRARQGSEVNAIHYGQVAFADWMGGFGRVLILDHGQGYMSIYANNRELHKATGDTVTPGEQIATVGESGGINSIGLYFEIRRNGQPVNPQSWVKKP